jgi:pilus assembly protein FimV
MPEEKIELIDDLPLDIDIETISLDNLGDKEILEAEVEENLESSSVKVEEFSNIQEIEGNTKKSEEEKPLSEITTENLDFPSLELENIEELSPSAEKETVGVPKGFEENAGILTETENIETEKEQLNAITEVEEDFQLEIEPGEIEKPEESAENITLSEADLNISLPGESGEIEIEDVSNESEQQLAESDINFGFEGIAKLESIEEIKEPEPPLTELAPQTENEIKEPYEKLQTDDIMISIDGSELDKLIYGEVGLSSYAKGYSRSEEVLESPVVSEVSEIEISSEPEELKAPTVEELVEISTPSLEPETLEEKEEVKLEEFQLEEISPESLSISTGETNIPIVEEEKTEEVLAVTPQEENIEELVSPEETLVLEEVPKAEEKPAEEFNFDLSVIPDVAEVDEDEPIALSLEELNNIEVSEESAIQYETPVVTEEPSLIEKEVEPELEEIKLEEGENIEVSLEDLTEKSQELMKEPSSLEVYGIEEPKGEELELTEVEKIFEEPVAKALTETGEVALEEKIDVLSPETKEELKAVLKYLDNLLEDLPPEKIKEFAKSEYYDLYIKILDKLGI